MALSPLSSVPAPQPTTHYVPGIRMRTERDEGSTRGSLRKKLEVGMALPVTDASADVLSPRDRAVQALREAGAVQLGQSDFYDLAPRVVPAMAQPVSSDRALDGMPTVQLMPHGGLRVYRNMPDIVPTMQGTHLADIQGVFISRSSSWDVDVSTVLPGGVVLSWQYVPGLDSRLGYGGDHLPDSWIEDRAVEEQLLAAGFVAEGDGAYRHPQAKGVTVLIDAGQISRILFPAPYVPEKLRLQTGANLQEGTTHTVELGFNNFCGHSKILRFSETAGSSNCHVRSSSSRLHGITFDIPRSARRAFARMGQWLRS